MTALAVLDVWQDLALGGGVAPQLVRDDHPQDVAQTAQQFVEDDPPRFSWTVYAMFAACCSAWSGVR
jgi:hypothetical protein